VQCLDGGLASIRKLIVMQLHALPNGAEAHDPAAELDLIPMARKV
jgi:hypothetical protein